MLNLARSYTNALLKYADEHGLEKVYKQALMFVSNEINVPDAPKLLQKFLVRIPGEREDILLVLYPFIDAARKKMNLVEAEVFSAVPLTDEQLVALEKKLVRIFHKQMDITTTVDPSLLGGIRVIVDNAVMDDTIKRKLADMKKRMYNGGKE